MAVGGVITLLLLSDSVDGKFPLHHNNMQQRHKQILIVFLFVCLKQPSLIFTLTFPHLVSGGGQNVNAHFTGFRINCKLQWNFRSSW